MLYWEEENRLMVLKDNNGINRYTYNAAGERIMKSYGTMGGVYINGAPQGITFHETDNFTLYPASILSVNKNRFTKHYFIGDKRVASRIGTGLFNNIYGRNGSYVTAGQQDYAERMNQIQKQKEAYYKQQGIAPGVPTMKGAYGDPENTKRGYNSIIDTLGNHDVPQGWIQTPRPNTTPNTNPGPPVSWNNPSNPDDPQAGYGYIPNDTTKEETFFYHSDHLGSTSYITDDKANITQYDAYLPYGELLVDEHSSSEDLPYKFNGKQFDEETGLYYYGARYMDPKISMWLGVDKLAEKYPTLGGYVYCAGNPIKLIDTDGNDIVIAGKNNSNITLKTNLIDIRVNATSLGIDFGGTYTLEGEKILSAALDIVGIFDPTGVADGLNATLAAKNGEWLDVGISVLGLLPYAGDLAKAGKIKKDVKIIEDGIEAVKGAKNLKYLRQKAVKDAWKAEKKLVERTGRGSRRWTKKELKELKETGKVKGYEGHHINSVKGHPEDAGDPSNIEFVKKGGEHLSRHNGNYRNPSSGKKINRD